MYIIRRIEDNISRYLDKNGNFGKKENARKFKTYKEAQERIELEIDDSKYDRYMGECIFHIELAR